MRLVRVYTCQNVKLLEISCRGSILSFQVYQLYRVLTVACPMLITCSASCVSSSTNFYPQRPAGLIFSSPYRFALRHCSTLQLAVFSHVVTFFSVEHVLLSNTDEVSCSMTQNRGFFGIVNCNLLVTRQTLPTELQWSHNR